jgi:acyl transferase domain-containing protein/acyl carrier protein
MKPRDEVSNSAVAVIGMAGRFPGANSVAELWENLRNGVESVSPITLEEWAAELNVHPSFLEKPDQVPWRPRIDGVELFDASFFGYTPREAQILDPQQRLFLECSWEALESAGYDSERFPGVIGVAVGISQSTYLLHYVQWDRELVANMGGLKIGLANMNDALATRVAYKLNLRGPAYAVQSFCSTSLVAVHLACQSLLNRESDMMLAGGVTVAVPQNAGYQYQEGGILSPDGHTRTFDAQGRGMVFANGLGCVVLKRLADALRDGDSIHGLILGSAVNNDGSVKVGFTAPSVNGQAEVIVEALAAADVNPETIGYVEAHGTATALGDPAEIAGLTKAWRRWTDKRRYCGIGSVKTNIGHLDAAAGVTGLVKAVLCLEKREIPPSLHFETPNPQIDFEASPFYVTARLADWPAPEGRPRRAAVSSFGIGGTNAHAVLEEAPPRPATDPARPWQLLVVSAKTASALDRATARLAAHLAAHPDQNLADAAFTLQLGRREFNHRRFAVVRDGADAVSALQHPARLEGGVAERQGAPVAFMFTGQGAQYVNMGRGLYEEEAVFRETLDACAEALRAPLGLDLRDVLFCRGRSEEQAAEELRQTRLTQPALFAVEYSLARLWMALGVEPSAMIGHSIGEYVAACVAGVFAFEDALALVAERGRLMQSLPAGGMLAVPLGEAALRPRLDPALDLASLNTPRASVVSGPLEAITRLERELMARDVACRLLHTSHAFHSRMMEPILPAFRERVAAVERRAPRLRFVSNATGDWISADQARDPEYWARHLRAPVRFSEGLARILAEANPVLLEVGPGGTLCALARQQDREEEPASVASLRHPKQEADDRAVLLGALGKLWLAGARVEWSRMHAGERRRRLELPSYPFERERYWVEPNKESRDGYNVARGYSLERQKIADWFYQVSWRRYLPAEVAGGPSQRRPASWLVFSDDTGIGQALVEELRAAGQRVVSVRPRARFAACDDGAFEIAPGQRADYDRLLDAIGEPGFVVHAWGVSPPDPRPPVERLAESHERGFLSLLFLAQSLARSQSKQTIQLAVVTSGMQDVVGGDLTCPEKATVLGPCRVIPQELTNVVSHAIDVEPAGLSREDARRQARWVLAELTSSQGDLVVAYRGGHRWVQSFEATPLEPADGRLPLEQRGVYLITGGLGGIGLALARHLAERWQARLVLTGRSPVPAREEWAARLESGDDATRKRIRDLLDLEARGAEVLYLRADVARREDVQAAVRAAHERFGPLQGLVHAAGVAGGGVIPLKDPAAAARVMAPKVQGTLLLEAELGAEPLDFVLLCSSTAALLGGFGQIDYCGANCFLDAQARRAGSPWAGRVVSVNWDAWKEVGMAVNTPVSGLLQVMRDFQLKLGISPGEGIDAFNRILAAGVPQVAVFTMDLRPGLARLALGRAPAVPLASAAATLDAGPAAAAVGEAVAEAEGPGGELERLVAQAFEKVLGRRNLGPDDNFFELGGDSLTAIQAIAVLKTRLGRDIPIVAFYESPTVAQLAKTLAPERDEKPEGVISEVGQRAATRRDLMQRRRQQRVQAAVDGRG